ncbi:MAG: hypothetical protein A2939_01395 [Parcubacteria group bacterium RIFCSPLOWO2_01_FULL_48_18]|nr:MAG: hypothetical protein A2939_01395 [Parcubacteria group bacterium RIFCSPLOWO2_01_FULL_48_18]OHB22138.1 MAG: hypothetical protein A3J67_04435 [Parcubacteria group bacterium RIFCSPHIGHO2_02_FULL_48_10b]
MKRDGYFAITTAIILSILVLMISVSLSLRSFNTRFDSLGFESKDLSRFLALGCLEEAIINVRTSSTYTGSTTVTIGSSTCRVLTITASGTDRIIPTEADINNRRTNLQALYRSSTDTILYIRELIVN